MQRWNWVMSADVNGRWLTTQGYAEVMLDGGTLQATLRYHPEDGGIYHWVDATISEDGVEAVVRSADSDVPLFQLGGTIFNGPLSDGILPTMVLLTDGTTVLSLAYGAHSDEGNF